MKNKPGVTEMLAKYAASLKYEDLPKEVTEIAKKCILDSVGITLGATTQGLGHEKLLGLIKNIGGREESTILGLGYKVPACMAAFANGALAGALDYDDILDDIPMHPSDVTVPASLAIAEHKGRVSGKDLITAVTLGNDIICRMGLSIAKRPKGYQLDWSFKSIFGIFGGTAACSNLLGLDAEQAEDAMGIALCQTAGTFQPRFTPDATIWNMSTGFPAMSAVLSSLMALTGITGGKRTLEGEAGFYKMYFEDDWNSDVLTADLGTKFEMAQLSFKPWPGIRHTHSYVDATLKIMREHNILSEDIRKVTLFVAGWVQKFCEPLEERRKPKILLEAKFSLPYLVAVAATRGRILIRNVTPAGLRDPDVLKFAEKVTWEHDDRFSAENKLGPAMVKIELRNGKSYTKAVNFAYGNPQNPISWQDLTDKFRDCASYSARPISKENIERIIEMISHLDEIDNIAEIIKFLY